MKELEEEVFDDECIDLDDLEEIKEKAKYTGKPIQERKRKKAVEQQLTLFDFMLGVEKKEESAREKLIKSQLKRGSGFERGKFRIRYEYSKNPLTDEYADFLKNEYGIGGYSCSEYRGSYNASGLQFSYRNDETQEFIEASLKWKEVANYIADLIDDDEYLTDEEKIIYENYRAQRCGSDKDRIKAIADWMVEHGTRYSWNGYYTFYNYKDNYDFVKEHIDEIVDELEKRDEIDKASYAQMSGFGINFKPVYCRCFNKEFYEAGAKLRAMRKGKEMEM